MPGGRPSDIGTIVGTTDAGEPITVADRIVNALRAGAYFERAVAGAGVHKETAYGWLRIAARLRIQASATGDIDALITTDHQRLCVLFSDAVDEAEAGWELSATASLERLGRGDIEIVTTTVETDGNATNPQVVKRVTRTERTLPDARVIMWRLERRFPERYGRRVEVTGVDGGPLLSFDDRVENLLDTFRAFREAEAAKTAPVAKPARPRRKRARKQA